MLSGSRTWGWKLRALPCDCEHTAVCRAFRAAWRAIDSGFSAVDAVVEGCSACEELRCDGTGGNMKPDVVEYEKK